MTALGRPATPEGLFLWVMHSFASRFDQHALLKGGMALRLLASPRSTTDIDYVFVPYASKGDVVADVEAVLRGLDDARVDVTLHSKMLRATVQVDAAQIQVEINVAMECAAVPMATGDFARAQGQPSQVIAVMHFDTALTEKLAAWNERRLVRDLYDCHFLVQGVGAKLDIEALDGRLSRIESRLPELRRRKRMTRGEFAEELRSCMASLTTESVEAELGALMPPEELAGLAPRIRVSVSRLVEQIEPPALV